MSTLHVKGGHLIDPASNLDAIADIYIGDGQIIAIGDAPDNFNAEQLIDAEGLMVSPGLVDLCARMREPGLEHKATIESESIAAASAGITTLCCPPDTDPVIDEPSVVELINNKATDAAHSNIVMLSALTNGLQGERLSEMHALQLAGCVGTSNCRRPVENSQVLKRAYAYAANCGLLVFIEPDDHWLSADGCAHEGTVANRLGLQGIPVSAETVALARALELVAETGVRAHFGRLSSASGVDMIRRAKASGLNITADVSAHHLHLTELDISSFNSACHVLPPLRTQRDQEALLRGVIDGTIDAICSDHQPHDADAKQAPFASTQPGISALETLLPLCLNLVERNNIDMQTAVRAITSTPANILGLNAGQLKPGTQADLCIFSTNESWQLEPQTMLSQGKHTPFAGWSFQGRARHTVINGVLVYSNNF